MVQGGATVSSMDTAPLRRVAQEVGQRMEAEGVWSAGLLQRIQAI